MTRCVCLLGFCLLMSASCDKRLGRVYPAPDPDMAMTKDLGAIADAAAAGCQRNADCPSTLCVDVQLGSYAPGSCVPAEALLYVDWDNCPYGARNGKFGNPFCEVQDAVDTIQPLDQQLHIFQVKASAHQYGGITIAHGNLALLGPWADPELKGTKWDEAAAAILVGSADPAHRVGLAIRVDADKGPVEAVVDGLSILAINTGINTGLAVDVSNFGPGSKLTLRRTTVSGSSGYGIDVENPGPFTLTMDRCKVTGNYGLALNLGSQTSMFTITNSLFSYNGIDGGTNAVTLDGVEAGVFDSNTVTYNGAMGVAGGIYCKRPQSISNTIVLKNSHVNGSQFLPLASSNCMLQNTIVDDLDENIKDGRKCNLGLTSQSLLTTALSTCAIDTAADKAERNLDYFGTRRPQGRHSDVGFHELVKPGG